MGMMTNRLFLYLLLLFFYYAFTLCANCMRRK